MRGHGPVPEIDPTWRLRVHGLGRAGASISPRHAARGVPGARGDRDAAVRRQPARRPDRHPRHPRRGALGPGATGTATWTGVALADVLALAGPRTEPRTWASTAPTSPEAMPAERFGGSIPLDKACRPEVLLAWAMNGEPLPPARRAGARGRARLHRRAERQVVLADRGPLGALAGGISSTSSTGCSEDETPGPGAGMPLGLVALNSDVLSPADGETVAAGLVEVRGYAFAGGSGTSRGSTSRSTAARPGRRPSCSRTSAGGPGGTGGSPSTSRPESTRSSSAPGTPRRPPSRRTRRRCGTRRATSTTPARGSGCAPPPPSRQPRSVRTSASTRPAIRRGSPGPLERLPRGSGSSQST